MLVARALLDAVPALLGGGDGDGEAESFPDLTPAQSVGFF
jgi:hypothetical protein